MELEEYKEFAVVSKAQRAMVEYSQVGVVRQVGIRWYVH